MKSKKKIKIPKEDLVKRIIYQTLKKRGIVHTQEELANLVKDELKKINKNFTITPNRVRRIAIHVDGVEITVKTKKSNLGEPKRCPVCGNKLTPVYGKNLLGEKIVLGFKCNVCNYRGDEKFFAPMKYEFKLLKK
ncbi:MAG: hypothetical protein J7L45_02070 [Candidatus Aenigmarchaeota archaeon]|nr:hypothetical protein [Candidatus Aenigmarchaeota archaeon]